MFCDFFTTQHLTLKIHGMKFLLTLSKWQGILFQSAVLFIVCVQGTAKRQQYFADAVFLGYTLQ